MRHVLASENEKVSGYSFEMRSVAHDLGNLLQVVSGALNAIERADASPRITLSDLLVRARGSLDRASQLSRRLSNGGREVPETLDLRTLLFDQRRYFELALGNMYRLVLTASDEPVQVLCDRMRLEAVLLNLLSNARDAMPAGGTIMLSLKRDASTSENACMSVADHGCGMSEGLLAMVREPYFTTKGTARGSGIGLAAAAAFAEDHGGQLEIASHEGRGTTVTLSIPVEEAANVRPDRLDATRRGNYADAA